MSNHLSSLLLCCVYNLYSRAYSVLDILGVGMEFLTEYGLFLAKVVTFVIALAIIIGLLAGAASQRSNNKLGTIVVKKYNDELEDMSENILDVILDKFQYKKLLKEREKKEKKEHKDAKKSLKKTKKKPFSDDDSSEKDVLQSRPRQYFVLDFAGDIRASEVDKLRKEISALLSVATPDDEVVIRLESSGGMVHAYGLGASQLQRIREASLNLTICVDMVAASGGYMMACLGNKIIAAPFAIVGSIGVVAQVPNFHRLLKKNDIDVEIMTAGEHKRSITMLGENTRKDKDKFEEDLQITHQLFKKWVSEQRPQVAIEEIANGDVWYGQEAINNHLVDVLGTSDDYLQQLVKNGENVVLVNYQEKKKIGEKLGIAAAVSFDTIVQKMMSISQRNKIES